MKTVLLAKKVARGSFFKQLQNVVKQNPGKIARLLAVCFSLKSLCSGIKHAAKNWDEDEWTRRDRRVSPQSLLFQTPIVAHA